MWNSSINHLRAPEFLIQSRVNTMYVLGLNAAYHDPSACLVKDGYIVAAAEEERFTHVKHGKRPIPFSAYELPFNAIDYCLKEAGITLADVAHVAYSYDPYLLRPQTDLGDTIELPLQPGNQHLEQGWMSPWDPLFITYIVNAPHQLVDGAPHHLQARFRNAAPERTFRWHYLEHHLAHEASAYLAAPFERCAVLTMDGRGEQATTSYGVFRDGEYSRLGQVNMPHSLGLLYERLTTHLGFLHSSDEYKVMALASFGEPRYLEAFRSIVTPGAAGQYRVADADLTKLFGPARLRGAKIEQSHLDIAHSLQVVLEETVLNIVRWLANASGEKNLAMAGGVALNCVMNAKLRDAGVFEQIWVQPAAGDSGTALGAALHLDRGIRQARHHQPMEHAFLGPQFSDDEIENFLRWSKLPYKKLGNIAEEVADLLVQDKVIGWFQGRMEFGPRALGARSILASPIHASMQARLNEIKDREDFRPVAPVVLEEEARHWFVNSGKSPFMLFVYDVAPDKADRIPAVRHVDGTARIQTINREQHPLYYDLIKAFQQHTGVPVLVNTSFNTRGEPIVCTPRDAIESFWTSPLDALVIGSYLLKKTGVPNGAADLRSRTDLQTPATA